MGKNLRPVWAGLVCLIMALANVSCLDRIARKPLADGWYNVKNMEKNIVNSKVIAKATDFRDLRVDSGRLGSTDQFVYMIVGRISDTEKWAKATEKAIGKHIAFLYEGKLVCAPQVNARIESGNFMINFPLNASRYDVETMFNALCDHACGTMNVYQYEGSGLPGLPNTATATLTVRKRARCDDGIFRLDLSSTNDSSATLAGKLTTLTLNGSTVWQCTDSTDMQRAYRFRVSDDLNQVTLVDPGTGHDAQPACQLVLKSVR